MHQNWSIFLAMLFKVRQIPKTRKTSADEWSNMSAILLNTGNYLIRRMLE